MERRARGNIRKASRRTLLLKKKLDPKKRKGAGQTEAWRAPVEGKSPEKRKNKNKEKSDPRCKDDWKTLSLPNLGRKHSTGDKEKAWVFGERTNLQIRGKHGGGVGKKVL